MLTTSELYNTIVTQPLHWFHTKINISGTDYEEDVLKSVSTSLKVFSEDQPTVGGCIASELEVKMINPSETIPRMATVRLYVCATDGTQTSEWLPQGVFYIDTREVSHNSDGLDILTLHCYDAMLKAEADYPSTATSFPKSDVDVVKEIAKGMGLQATISETTGIDSRTLTLMDNNYQIGLPVGFSMRETLGNIAAMYAGNFIMNYEGQLRLITLAELPPETYYLIDSLFEPITFGGDHILV